MSHINLARLNPYELHKHLINEYYLKRPGDTKQLERDNSKDKTDLDVIRENHRFLWESSDVLDTWEKQLAKRYYDKLFKEYCICDLSRYKENKVALRWRIEKEVVVGKGQFICGNKICSEKEQLRSWEVNFGYMENEEKKNALIKLRLCPDCSKKLNYHSKKREVKRCRKRKTKSLSGKIVDPSTSDNVSEKDTIEPVIESQNSKIDEMSEDYQNDIPGDAEQIWTKAPDIEDKSREQEFDEYLENLLL